MSRRVCFPYALEELEPLGQVPNPIVDLAVRTSQGDWVILYLYADTGADITLFPRSVSEVIGLDLEAGERTTLSGVGGGEVGIFIHRIVLKLGQYEVQARVAIAEVENIPYLLGRVDILDRFDLLFQRDRVCFKKQRRWF